MIGGLFTTYASWRWVFAGEVLFVLVILALSRRMADSPAERGVKLDLVGTFLSAVGLAMIVFGIIRAGTWGFVQPKPEAPQWLGASPVIWLLLGGAGVLTLFLLWENWRLHRGRAVLIRPSMLRVRGLQAGLTSFFFQYLLQSGLFFVIPLFLSVALGLSAVATGVRLLPLSITLLAAAVGVPRLFRSASPRRVVRVGFAMITLGIVILIMALDAGAGPDIVTWPLLLIGLGVGSLASQLGSVTVSSLPTSESGEVGGIQNTVTNLGASIGTALAGTVLVAVLTTTFLGAVSSDPAVPQAMASQAQVELSAGIPFVSDADLGATLEKAGVPSGTAQAIVDDNASARINGLRAALAVLAFMALLGLAMTNRLPTVQPAGEEGQEDEAAEAADEADDEGAEDVDGAGEPRAGPSSGEGLSPAAG